MPRIPGIEHAISSDGFFGLSTMPRSVAIVGGGYISVELAGVLRTLGADVTVITRADNVLRGFDVRRQLAAPSSAQWVTPHRRIGLAD